MRDQDHWQSVYLNKNTDDVSWFRPHLERSLAMIAACALPPSAHIVDVGGGASTLVDDLLTLGHAHLTVIDLAPAALSAAQRRLGPRADAVDWIVGDATSPLLDPHSVDLWHDRAVLHFLTAPAQRDAYAAQVARCLRPGGFALISAFAPDGPERCSGLPVMRHDPDTIAAVLGPAFSPVDAAREVHLTPAGAAQPFSYALLRKLA